MPTCFDASLVEAFCAYAASPEPAASPVEAEIVRHLLAEADWDSGLPAEAARMILARRGVACPELEPFDQPRRRAFRNGRDAIFEFGFDRALVKDLESLRSRASVSYRPVAKNWRAAVTVATALPIAQLLSKHSIPYGAALAELLIETAESAAISAARSAAETPSTGFVPPPLGAMTPRPYQVSGMEYLEQFRRALIGDQPGMGKTLTMIGAVEAAGRARKSKPVFVVCPATARLGWKREILRCLPNDTVVVVSAGKNHEPVDFERGGPAALADWWVTTWDFLPRGRDVVPKPGAKKRRVFDFVDAVFAQLAPTTLILDESRRCANPTALRTKAVKHVKTAHKKALQAIHLADGTPMTKRPVQLVPQLDVCGLLYHFGGSTAFKERYCAPKRTPFGVDYSGASNLSELNERLREIGYLRREKKDVLADMPPRQWAPVECPLSNRREYDALEEGFDAEATASRAAGVRTSHLAVEDALLQAVARGKLEFAIAWIREFLETGQKLVVFAHHVFVVERLIREFKCLSIYGKTSAKARQEAIDAFQSDPEAALLAANWKSAGESITLTAASDAAVLEFPPTPGDMDQMLDRLHRLGQDNPVTGWLLFAPDSYDVDRLADLEASRRVVGEATIGASFIELADEENIASDAVSRLLARRKKRNQGSSLVSRKGGRPCT